jgi:hypothetical protein
MDLDSLADDLKRVIGEQAPLPDDTDPMPGGIRKPSIPDTAHQRYYAPTTHQPQPRSTSPHTTAHYDPDASAEYVRQAEPPLADTADLAAQNAPVDSFITPDVLYNSGDNVSFIYTRDGQMFYGKNRDKHWEMMIRTPELVDRYKLRPFIAKYQDEVRQALAAKQNDGYQLCSYCRTETPLGLQCTNCGADLEDQDGTLPGETPAHLQPRKVATKYGDLVGRIGFDKANPNVPIVSLWNSQEEDYQFLEPCLKRLAQDNLIAPGDYVSTPLHGTVPLDQALTAEIKPLDMNDQEKVELWHKLHLMKPADKQAAMRKLGLKVGSTKNAWQQEAEKNGVARPGQKYWAMNSEAAEISADNLLMEWEIGEWITPDVLYASSISNKGHAFPFIYAANGEIFYGSPNNTHASVVSANPQLKESSSPVSDPLAFDWTSRSVDDVLDFDLSPGSSTTAPPPVQRRRTTSDAIRVREKLGAKGSLWGRVSSDGGLVSFWNKDAELYERLLVPCLEKLMTDGKLQPGHLVSTPVHGTVEPKDLESAARSLNDEEAQKADLWRQLHLMKPEEKKIAMKALGLLGPKPKSAFRQEAEKQGVVTPGHKLWAPTSEERVAGEIDGLLTETSSLSSDSSDDEDCSCDECQYDEYDDETDCKESGEFCDPDTLYHHDYAAVPFIYGGGQMYYGPVGRTHWHILRDLGYTKSIGSPDAADRAARTEAAKGMLFGRFSPSMEMVSFWTGPKILFEKELDDCLKHLAADGHIDFDEWYVSTPIHGTVPLNSFDFNDRVEVSPEEEARRELQMQLHLMRGNEKKAAMKQLGLIGPKPKTPFRQEAERQRVVAPGHKMWAPTSESVLREWREGEWINPDILYQLSETDPNGNVAIPFVYTLEGKMHYGKPGGDHFQLNNATPALRYELYDDDFENDDAAQWLQQHVAEAVTAPKDLDLALKVHALPSNKVFARNLQRRREDQLRLHKDLAGRVSADRKMVSFWNESIPLYEKNFGACLQKLMDDGKIDPDCFISTPVHGTMPLGEIEGFEMQEVTPEQSAQIALWRKLHLMRGPEKKAAMKELGLIGPKPKSEFRQEAENQRIVAPGHKLWAPTSEELVANIDDLLTEWEKSDQYHNPDKIAFDYNNELGTGYADPFPNAVAFIYGKSGMHYADPGAIHSTIAGNHPDGDAEYPGNFMSPIMDKNLVGRVSNDRQLVSFWNNDEAVYDEFFTKCMNQLLADQTVQPNYFVSTPLHGTLAAADLQGEERPEAKEMSPEERERYELYQKLHLMPPEEKKAAMNKLGLKVGYTKNKWQQEAEAQEVLRPGQKYWAMTSEGTIREWARGPWVDPDDVLYQNNPHGSAKAICFIYGPVGDPDVAPSMYWAPGACHNELQDADGNEVITGDGLRKNISANHLLGRISDDGDLVSFWNKESGVYDYVEECLEPFIEDGYLDANGYLSSPLHGTVPLSDVGVARQLSPEEAELVDLREKLHLLRGNEKKAAMVKLGLIGPKPKTPFRQEAENQRIVAPGHKMWAPTSESRQSE